jgi:hypothetical protein
VATYQVFDLRPASHPPKPISASSAIRSAASVDGESWGAFAATFSISRMIWPVTEFGEWGDCEMVGGRGVADALLRSALAAF